MSDSIVEMLDKVKEAYNDRCREAATHSDEIERLRKKENEKLRQRIEELILRIEELEWNIRELYGDRARLKSERYELKARIEELGRTRAREALKDLYRAGHWVCGDIPHKKQVELWESARRALAEIGGEDEG
jgi:predicted nuclease with TOPRIM domain